MQPIAPPLKLRLIEACSVGATPRKALPRDAISKATAPHTLCWGRFLDTHFGGAVLSSGDVAHARVALSPADAAEVQPPQLVVKT